MVEQSFGNYPQYIQTRVVTASAAPQEVTIELFDTIVTSDIALIEDANTLFITTSAEPADCYVAEGADASHWSDLVRIREIHVLKLADCAVNR